MWYNKPRSKSPRKKTELESGFYVRCRLATLIEQVHVAPTENPWFEPIVKNVLEKYGINAQVIQSGLKLTPR